MRPPLSPEDEAIIRELEKRKPSELVPLLLELARRTSARRRPADLLAQFARDTFVVPCPIDQRTAVELDRLALEVASDYEALLLSPLAPLGTCSVVSPTTQDRSVTTSRTTEVVSDPTNVLAIECARRLLAGERHVRLCTLHQVVRAQRFSTKGFAQHFRMFALVEAGWARPEHGFEVDAVVALAGVFVRLFERVEQVGLRVARPRAKLLVAERAGALGERVRARLAERLPDLPVEEVTPFASNYYDGLRLVVEADTPAGDRYELGDVGIVDWMAKLTSNARTRFVAAGIGIQLLALSFRSPPGEAPTPS